MRRGEICQRTPFAVAAADGNPAAASVNTRKSLIAAVLG